MEKTRTNPAHRCSYVFVLTVSLILASPASSLEKDFPEAKIKVAYLFNFLRFIEWPEDIEINTNICVIGDKKEYRDALQSLSNQSLNNQAITIRIINDNDSPQLLQNCQIIFITSVASHRQKMIFNILKGGNALTVGENKGFAMQGGMINFLQQDDKIRFEINLRAVNEAGLRITSKILRIAYRVINGEKHE